MCANTLNTTIKQKSVEDLGYYFADALRPRHCFQFAEDSSVITANEEDNQLLLNLFTKMVYLGKFKNQSWQMSHFWDKKNGNYSMSVQASSAGK